MEDDNDKTYVKLVSADGPEFFIERRIALQVDTMKAMLEGNFRESEEGGQLVWFFNILYCVCRDIVRWWFVLIICCEIRNQYI